MVGVGVGIVSGVGVVVGLGSLHKLGISYSLGGHPDKVLQISYTGMSI